MTAITMRKLDKGGSVKLWEPPRPECEYIIGADVAQGATFGEARDDRDSSTICILRREPQRVVQVCEAASKLSTYDFGKLVAAMGVWYNYAWVNVERNMAHGVIAGLEAAGYPSDRWYQPPVQTSVTTHHSGQYFTYKTQQTGRMLIDLLSDYMNPDSGQLVLKSKTLVEEIAALQKDNTGRVETNGRDLTIALCMALVVDRDVDPILPGETNVRKNVWKEGDMVPFGVDPENYIRANSDQQKRGTKDEPFSYYALDGGVEWEAEVEEL